MALKRMDTGRTTVLLTLALLFSAITGSAWSQKTSRTEPSRSAKPQQADSLAEAETLLQKQQYAEAEQKLATLVSEQAENPQAWFDLGFAQSHLNKTGEAVASYRKAAGLSPKWFEASLNLGVALAKSNDYAAATPVLQHAVTLKPTAGGNKALSKAWQSLAQVLEKTDAKAAAAAYDKAVELDASQTELTLNAGRALQSANDLPGAEEHFRKSADSGNAQGMVMLINLLSGQKRYTEAEGWLTKYVAKNPQDSKARFQLGRFLASQGKSQEAIAVLQNQSQLNGQPAGNPEIDRELAELYLQTKQYAQAEPLFRGLSQTTTTDPDLHFGLGVAVLHQLKYAEAEREFIQTVKLKPDYGEAYGYLADAARENKHYELAIRALDARAKFLPEDARSYFIRATSFDNLHMFKPAAENYKKFLAIAAGKFPDQEFQARHRLKAIQPE
jgi:tetratricopeptide (TPR) repeat protein